MAEEQGGDVVTVQFWILLAFNQSMGRFWAYSLGNWNKKSFSTHISHCINTFDACVLEHMYSDLTFIISLMPTLTNKIQAPGIQGLSNGPEKAMNTWTCGHGGILTWFWCNHRKHQAWRSLFDFSGLGKSQNLYACILQLFSAARTDEWIKISNYLIMP